MVQQHLAAAPVACTNPQYFVLRDNKRVTGLRIGEGGKWVVAFPANKQEVKALIHPSVFFSLWFPCSLPLSLIHTFSTHFFPLSPTVCLLHLSLPH